MQADQNLEQSIEVIVDRTRRRFERYRQRSLVDTDRLFVKLFVGQWLFAILIAVLFSPYSWQGKLKVVHLHVWIAIFLGAAIISLPIALALKRPGETITRHTVSVAQMLFSALLIHLTGGRIETHFHVFGSLAFLAFYLDWAVLLTAAITVSLDHIIRGLVWPESVYGIPNPEWWRFLEHSFWVLFCLGFLIVSCRRHIREWLAAAEEGGLIEAMAESEWREKSVLERSSAEHAALEK